MSNQDDAHAFRHQFCASKHGRKRRHASALQAYTGGVPHQNKCIYIAFLQSLPGLQLPPGTSISLIFKGCSAALVCKLCRHGLIFEGRSRGSRRHRGGRLVHVECRRVRASPTLPGAQRSHEWVLHHILLDLCHLDCACSERLAAATQHGRRRIWAGQLPLACCATQDKSPPAGHGYSMRECKPPLRTTPRITATA
jgi:hypothetical protein